MTLLMEHLWTTLYEMGTPLITTNSTGLTSYLDFFKLSDLHGHPVVIGVDGYQRPFILVAYIVDNKKLAVECYFRRYKDNMFLWMSAGAGVMRSVGGMNTVQSDFLTTFLTGDKLKVHYINDEALSMNAQSVYLYSDNWNKAAMNIQKHWDICRYNPEYTICRKILLKEYTKIFVDKSC